MLLTDCSTQLASELTDEFDQVGSQTTAAELQKNLEKYRFKYDYSTLSDRMRRASDPAEKNRIMKQINELLLKNRTV